MWPKLFILILVLVQHLDATCDVCQAGRAACHSRNTYSICMDGEPTNDEIPCPTGFICTGEKYICYKETEYEPICTPPVDLDALCTSLGKTGNYENTEDPTCKSFVYCVQQEEDGPLTGYIYDCTSKKPYFYGKGCQAEKPSTCT